MKVLATPTNALQNFSKEQREILEKIISKKE
jgi:hypothetical protein